MLTFSFRGCRVSLGFSCLALGAFCCLFAGGENGAWLLLAMALHEGGHLLALWALGAPPRQVVLSALGCRLVLDPRRKLGCLQSGAASLAGPGANLLGYALAALAGRGERPFALACLGLGILHSLPIQPLDGGLALGALLCRGMDGERAERWARGISLALLLPLAALGFLVLLRTRYNFTLLALCVYLMLFLVLKEDAPAP